MNASFHKKSFGGKRRIRWLNKKETVYVAAGCGPEFPVDDFPEPLRTLTPRKLFAILGPAIIALGGTIGGGEWLIGPSMFVKYGLALLWITTISSLLQVFLNLEMVRYTMYTGEPITVGFMRLKPGKGILGLVLHHHRLL